MRYGWTSASVGCYDSTAHLTIAAKHDVITDCDSGDSQQAISHSQKLQLVVIRRRRKRRSDLSNVTPLWIHNILPKFPETDVCWNLSRYWSIEEKLIVVNLLITSSGKPLTPIHVKYEMSWYTDIITTCVIDLLSALTAKFVLCLLPLDGAVPTFSRLSASYNTRILDEIYPLSPTAPFVQF